MPSYKVEYIHTSPEHKKWYKVKKKVDGLTLKSELEALLLEYSQKGYKVISIESIQVGTMEGTTITDGLIVVFEKKE